MKGINNRKRLNLVQVFYYLNGENYVTAYKRTDALEMLLKLSNEGATINKLVEFEA